MTALITEPQQSGRMECPHLDKLCGRAGTVFPCLADGKRFRCGECGTEQSIWLCVTCGATNCGRYVAAHGLMHKVKYLCSGETTITKCHCMQEKTKGHSVCMDTAELAVFCYDCDEFVMNDTADRVLESLRSLVLTKRLQLEAETETPVL